MELNVASLSNLFRQWEISEETITKFKEQKINVELLPHITENILDRYMHFAADKIRFKLNCESLKTPIQTPNTVIPSQIIPRDSLLREQLPSTSHHNDSLDNAVFIDVHKDLNPQEVLSAIERGEFSIIGENLELTSTPKNNQKSLPAAKSQGLISINDTAQCFSPQTHLASILREYSRGREVLEYYKTNKSLDHYNRGLLAHVIIDEELKTDFDKRITASRFTSLAQSVVKTFPTESLVVWIVFTEKKRCITGKGKLYTTWYSKRRHYVRKGLIKGKSNAKRSNPSLNNTEVTNSDEPQEPEGLSSHEEILKHITEPWSKIEECWDQSYQFRRKIVEQCDNKPIIDYLQRYPSCGDNKAYTLFEKDFARLLPGCSDQLFIQWPRLCVFLENKIRGYRKSFIKDGLRDDLKTVSVLAHMGFLLTPGTVVKRKRNVPEYHPTKAEAQEAFMLHLCNFGELEGKLRERRAKLLPYGGKLQPFALIIGRSLEKITQSYVVLDTDYVYKVDTPLRAIDVTFKCIYAINAAWPLEASRIWHFLERAGYGISQNGSTYSNELEILIREFELFKEKSQ